MKRPTAEGVAIDVLASYYDDPAHVEDDSGLPHAVATAMQRAMDEFYRPLREAARAVWQSVPAEHEGPQVEQHARALNALAAALREVDDGEV